MATKKIIFQQNVDSTKGLDATANNKLAVKVDGTTVQFNGSGQLTATSSGGSPVAASGSVAGVVNLTSMQVLGAGDKVINGVRVGRGAGDSIYNTTIGRDALLSNTTGQFNAAFGYESLKENIGGSSNTAIGDRTLQNNTIGNNNTAIGSGALLYNTTGTDNTAIGHSALLSNTEGNNNTAIGWFSLNNNITGNNNTAIGYSTSAYSSTANDTTAIGHFANASYDNSTAIGKGASTTAANQVVLGNNLVTETVIYGALSVNGPSSMGSGSVGLAGEVLTSAGPGVAPTWAAASGGSPVDASSTVAGVVNLTSMQVLGAGDKVINGVRVGRGAGDSIYNTTIGRAALLSNTAGENNTAVGYQALFDNTTGSNNTAVGYQALINITTGSNNTGIGNNAVASTATVDNEITLGNSSVTALRCQVTSITSLSDERDKTDWNYNIAGLKFINDLKPAYFTWNTRDQAKVGIKAAGFSAQDLLRVQEQYDAEHLDLVSLNNPEKLEARYSNLLPVLVKAIQEMSQAHDLEIQNLRSEINELKKIMSSK